MRTTNVHRSQRGCVAAPSHRITTGARSSPREFRHRARREEPPHRQVRILRRRSDRDQFPGNRRPPVSLTRVDVGVRVARGDRGASVRRRAWPGSTSSAPVCEEAATGTKRRPICGGTDRQIAVLDLAAAQVADDDDFPRRRRLSIEPAGRIGERIGHDWPRKSRRYQWRPRQLGDRRRIGRPITTIARDVAIRMARRSGRRLQHGAGERNRRNRDDGDSAHQQRGVLDRAAPERRQLRLAEGTAATGYTSTRAWWRANKCTAIGSATSARPIKAAGVIQLTDMITTPPGE